jgi:hypothetical protein
MAMEEGRRRLHDEGYDTPFSRRRLQVMYTHIPAAGRRDLFLQTYD